MTDHREQVRKEGRESTNNKREAGGAKDKTFWVKAWTKDIASFWYEIHVLVCREATPNNTSKSNTNAFFFSKFCFFWKGKIGRFSLKTSSQIIYEGKSTNWLRSSQFNITSRSHMLKNKLKLVSLPAFPLERAYKNTVKVTGRDKMKKSAHLGVKRQWNVFMYQRGLIMSNPAVSSTKYLHEGFW